MRFLFFCAVLFLVCRACTNSAHAAEFVDTFLESSIAVQTVTLVKRADGGCAVIASASIAKPDGGLVFESMLEPRDVAGANRTTCLDIMDTKAPVLFKAERGF